MLSTNTTAHKWLRKVIQEHGNANRLSIKTNIPVNNFYFWEKKKIKEGADLIDNIEYITRLQNVSKFKSLSIKLMPSLKNLK